MEIRRLDEAVALETSALMGTTCSNWSSALGGVDTANSPWAMPTLPEAVLDEFDVYRRDVLFGIDVFGEARASTFSAARPPFFDKESKDAILWPLLSQKGLTVGATTEPNGQAAPRPSQLREAFLEMLDSVERHYRCKYTKTEYVEGEPRDLSANKRSGERGHGEDTDCAPFQALGLGAGRARRDERSGISVLRRVFEMGTEGLGDALRIRSHVVSPEQATFCWRCKERRITSVETVVAMPFGQCTDCEALLCTDCAQRRSRAGRCDCCQEAVDEYTRLVESLRAKLGAQAASSGSSKSSESQSSLCV